MKKISAIIACYKDAQAIPEMYQRLTSVLTKIKYDYEIIFVNDGSPDNSEIVLDKICNEDKKVTAIFHSRNFGTDNAFSSGMVQSKGDAVVLLDGDLQDPPELIPDLISKWDKNKIINAYLEAPKKGFNTELMGKDLLHWSSLLLGISRKGLLNRDILNKSNDNEAKFLNHLDKLIDKKTTNADHMIDKFSKNENLNDLYDK